MSGGGETQPTYGSTMGQAVQAAAPSNQTTATGGQAPTQLNSPGMVSSSNPFQTQQGGASPQAANTPVNMFPATVQGSAQGSGLPMASFLQALAQITATNPVQNVASVTPAPKNKAQSPTPSVSMTGTGTST